MKNKTICRKCNLVINELKCNVCGLELDADWEKITVKLVIIEETLCGTCDMFASREGLLHTGLVSKEEADKKRFNNKRINIWREYLKKRCSHCLMRLMLCGSSTLAAIAKEEWENRKGVNRKKEKH